MIFFMITCFGIFINVKATVTLLLLFIIVSFESIVSVKYFIDKGAEKHVSIEGIPVIMPNIILEQEKVDAIIVADFLNYPQILEELIEKEIMLPIVCLKDIMFEI